MIVGLPWPASKSGGTEIGKCFPDLCIGIHNKRAILYNRFLDWLSLQHDQQSFLIAIAQGKNLVGLHLKGVSFRDATIPSVGGWEVPQAKEEKAVSRMSAPASAAA